MYSLGKPATQNHSPQVLARLWVRTSHGAPFPEFGPITRVLPAFTRATPGDLPRTTFNARTQLRLHRIGLSCVAALSSVGCVVHISPDESNPVPIKVALEVVERDLKDAAPVKLGEIDTLSGKAEITKAIQAAQCSDDSSNPLMPVISAAISLALQGSITKAQGGTATASLTPSLAYQYTVTKGQQQQVTVPVTFVPLSTLPDFYLGQNLANFNGLSDAEKKKYVDQLEPKRKAIADLISGLPAFNASTCEKDPQKRPIVPFMRVQ